MTEKQKSLVKAREAIREVGVNGTLRLLLIYMQQELEKSTCSDENPHTTVEKMYEIYEQLNKLADKNSLVWY